MSSFEFYSLPTEIKRIIFNINKPKYNYDEFVKCFNKRVEWELADYTPDEVAEYGDRYALEFSGYGIWIEVFLNPHAPPTYCGLSLACRNLIMERGARQYFSGDGGSTDSDEEFQEGEEQTIFFAADFQNNAAGWADFANE